MSTPDSAVCGETIEARSYDYYQKLCYGRVHVPYVATNKTTRSYWDAMVNLVKAAPAACEWQMVPKEPTEEMCDAGYTAARAIFEEDGCEPNPHDWAKCYKAMLAAAPSPAPDGKILVYVTAACIAANFRSLDKAIEGITDDKQRTAVMLPRTALGANLYADYYDTLPTGPGGKQWPPAPTEDALRQRFEEWMASSNYPEIADVALAKLPDGTYKSQLTFAAWQAWKAPLRLALAPAPVQPNPLADENARLIEELEKDAKFLCTGRNEFARAKLLRRAIKAIAASKGDDG